jgi:hypothetical protein
MLSLPDEAHLAGAGTQHGGASSPETYAGGTAARSLPERPERHSTKPE